VMPVNFAAEKIQRASGMVRLPLWDTESLDRLPPDLQIMPEAGAGAPADGITAECLFPARRLPT
jgi:hypothetical protein